MSNLFYHISNLVIADDDLDDQLLFKEAIEDFPGSVNLNTVADGCQLMTLLQLENLPDLIFLDLNMPNKNGMECLAEIRSDNRLTHVPVIIFSTSKDKRDIDACYEGGANLFFSKPHKFETLKALIHSALRINWGASSFQVSKTDFFKIALEEMPFSIS